MSAEPERQRRQRLLEAVLAGEIEPTAAEVADACRDDAEFAVQLAELIRIQQQLTAHGREARDDLREPAPALEAAAERAMRRAIEPRHDRRRWNVWLVAAAVLAISVLGWWWSRATPAGSQVLGGFPVAATADGRGLAFGHQLAEGEYFLVTVVDAAGNTMHASPRLRVATWRPDAALVARWAPDWRVTVVAESSDMGRTNGRPLPGWVPAR
ncbi:MAG TPA: hypothetical protein VFZ65_12960 [Planctomycetota bacterium]|nr:hypothetical protein [Planctomycetota bacterium]